MVLKLDSLYAVHSTSRKVIAKRKLLQVKLTDNEKPEDFFSNFEKALNELQSTGESITEEERLIYLLLALCGYQPLSPVMAPTTALS